MSRPSKKVPVHPPVLPLRIFTDLQRQQIETAYGQGSLSREIWLQIREATAVYTSYNPEVASVAELRIKLDKLRALADSTKRVLGEMSYSDEEVLGVGHVDEEPGLTRMAKLRSIYDTYFRRDILHFNVDTKAARTLNGYATRLQIWHARAVVAVLKHSLNALMEVIDFSSSEIADFGSTISLSDMWKDWIWFITIIMKEHDLTYVASADIRQTTLSPFVVLIDELQKCIPEKYRLHYPRSTLCKNRMACSLSRSLGKSIALEKAETLIAYSTRLRIRSRRGGESWQDTRRLGQITISQKSEFVPPFLNEI